MIIAIAERLIRMPPFKGRMRLVKALLQWRTGRPVRSVYGVLVRANVRDFTNWACISGVYSRDYDDVYAEVDALSPGMAFLDVGANLGLFSLVAGQRVGPKGIVLSFEPNLGVFAELVANIRANALTNAIPLNVAIGAESGAVRFDAGAGSHTGVGHISDEGAVTVPILSPSDAEAMFSQLLGARDAVVKVDVEGAELMVVRGLAPFLRRPQFRKVILEIDGENLGRFGHDPAQVYALMTELGFTARRGLGATDHYNEIFER